MSSISGEDALAPEVRELLDRRASLQKWLVGLEAQRGITSERILQRVREDYEGRLSSTNEALSSHVNGIRAEMDRAAERSADAERIHDAAVDALEEARLRHAIGELPGDGWEDRERELMDAVRSAKIAEDASRTEVDRLHELLGTLTNSDSPAEVDFTAILKEDAGAESSPSTFPEDFDAAPRPSALPESTFADSVDSDATVESGSAAPNTGFTPAPQVAAAEGEGTVYPDRAPVELQAEAPQPEAPGLFDEDEVPSAEKAPPPGLKCGECGYTNDLSAWFCGVCGADVG